MVVHLVSPNDRYDMLYLRNYARLNVKDELAKISGIGQINMFGSGNYAMRVWLNPQKVAERNMNPDEVVAAIRKQNIQVAAGVIGGAPYKDNVEIQLPVNVQGRLSDVDQFENIIIKRDGGVVTLPQGCGAHRDRSQRLRAARVAGQQAGVGAGDFPVAGGQRHRDLEQCAGADGGTEQAVPQGLEYRIAYDPTTFVRDSIKAVTHTLIEAIVLVVLVVILFLQTWRAAIIPLLAVPVSVVGTFAAMHAFRFLDQRAVAVRAWCSRSASSWMTPSWWWRTWNGTSPRACRPAMRRSRR